MGITPKFMNKDDPEQNLKKLAMEVRVGLESSQDWISAPEYFILNNSGKTMDIRVDPTQLNAGLHFGSISGYDVNNLAIGPLFKIPVTVCKPDEVTSTDAFIKYENMRFGPGDISRHFIKVPVNSNFAG